MSAVTSNDFAPLAVLIVDDEAPARDRLRDLLGDIADTQPTRIVGMAASGIEALLRQTPAQALKRNTDRFRKVLSGERTQRQTHPRNGHY